MGEQCAGSELWSWEWLAEHCGSDIVTVVDRDRRPGEAPVRELSVPLKVFLLYMKRVGGGGPGGGGLELEALGNAPLRMLVSVDIEALGNALLRLLLCVDIEALGNALLRLLVSVDDAGVCINSGAYAAITSVVITVCVNSAVCHKSAIRVCAYCVF